jgi:hypothetical protein
MKLDENDRILSRGLPNIHHVNDTNMVWGLALSIQLLDTYSAQLNILCLAQLHQSFVEKSIAICFHVSVRPKL